MHRITPVVQLLLAALVLVLVSAPSPSARTWYIKPDGTGDAPTIQAGVDSAAVSDTLLLANGEFHESRITLPQELVIRGDGQGASRPRLNADFDTRVFQPDHPGGSISFYDLEFANASQAAIYATSADVRVVRCHFEGNGPVSDSQRTPAPGGVYLYIGSLEVIDCAFVANRGSGVFVHSFDVTNLIVEGSYFSDNTAESGAGIYGRGLTQTSRISDCVFVGNAATNGGGGARLHVSDDAVLQMRDCTFQKNFAAIGGGLLATSSYPHFGGRFEIQDCIFQENEATARGGALSLWGSSGHHVVEGCLLLHNRAETGGAIDSQVGGVTIRGSSIFDSNEAVFGACVSSNRGGVVIGGVTFVRNTASESQIDVTTAPSLIVRLRIDRAIIAFSPSGIPVYRGPEVLVDVSCTDIYGNADGDWVGILELYAPLNNNFSADPLFCDLDNGDFTLAANSPCLPESGLCGGLIGALGQGCGPVSRSLVSWAKIKSRYR